jgi:HEAT repeat protein
MVVVSSGGSARRTYLLIAAAAVVLIGVTALALLCGRPKVEGDTPKQRGDSIVKLADERPAGADRAIAAEAVHPDPTVRRVAMIGLGKFTTAQNRPTVEAGTKDQVPIVRAAAARTLGLYQDDAAADRLGEMLNNDPNDLVRLAAAAGLGQNNTAKATVLLVEAAEKSKDPRVQFRAMQVLLEKYNVHFVKPVDPENRAYWKNLVEHVKRFGQVRDAYRQVGRPLSVPPEHHPIASPEATGG